MVRSILSAVPFAILPMVEAVAGATSMASAQSPKSTWLFHEPSRLEKNSLMTGLRLSVESVRGVMNSLPAGVMTTCTSAPFLTSPLIISAAL
ncbi:hypothetical protein Barb4_03279 [Bacteroidales bacterium Barb4]|nr:hypothetical protein Barb4_03279 [Bacteroidales bacterium Barb4]